MKRKDLPKELDFGGGHKLTWLTNREDDVIGAIESHLKPDGTLCEGAIAFNVPERTSNYGEHPCWEVLSWEPLTLSPSLLCTVKDCQNHGWIREGKWVPA